MRRLRISLSPPPGSAESRRCASLEPAVRESGREVVALGTTHPVLPASSGANLIAHAERLAARFCALETLPTKAAELEALALEIDRFKRGLHQRLRPGTPPPSLEEVERLARVVAILHKKPDHAGEVISVIAGVPVSSWDDLEYIRSAMLVRDLGLAASLVTLGELETPTAIINFNGRLSPEDRARHIAPINARAAKLVATLGLGLDDVAAAIRGDPDHPLTLVFHVVRDVAAMSHPRAWRRAEYPPDGVLPPAALRAAVLDNAKQKRLDIDGVERTLRVLIGEPAEDDPGAHSNLSRFR